jgi:hypothetical protein
MMKTVMKLNSIKKVASVLVLLASGALAQNNSAVSSVTITATLPETLTVSLDQIAITFALTAGSATNPGNTAVVATTSWALAAGRTDVKLYAYFDTAAAALSQGAVDIAGTTITAKVGGVSAGNFATDLSLPGTGLTIFDQVITAANLIGSNSSSVALNIDLTSLPALPVGAYTGTLHFMAQTI